MKTVLKSITELYAEKQSKTPTKTVIIQADIEVQLLNANFQEVVTWVNGHIGLKCPL